MATKRKRTVLKEERKDMEIITDIVNRLQREEVQQRLLSEKAKLKKYYRSRPIEKKALSKNMKFKVTVILKL